MSLSRRSAAAAAIVLGALAPAAHAQSSGGAPGASPGNAAPPAASPGNAAPPGDEKEACAAAFERAQELELSGRLNAARASFVRCAADTCPAVLSAPCVKGVQRLDADIPSIVIAARGGAGDELRDVRVLVDGETRAERLDGTAIRVDPGSHRVRVERRGSPPAERDVLVRVGERNRPVELTFADVRAPAATAAPQGAGERAAAPGPRTKIPAIAALVAGGVGVAVGAVAGGLALANKLDLDGACPTKDTCDPARESQIAAMRAQSTVSTVGFAAGAAALAVGAVLFAIAGRAPSPAGTPGPAGTSSPPRASITLGPGSLGLRGSF